ncbi:MAG: class I SAM-dependent methyltransferase [Bacteroidetes bacterium]|nr:class I SAM-dependent methyltransferase [Bacteroidota bacterium]MBS1650358.1 class I SAM-dependent methyltransferase [Bacteroidota bacterium]
MSVITYSQCPSCQSSNISKALQAKDYTVSKEIFEIWHCNQCTLRFTQNIPDVNHIAPYYQSTAYISHSDTQEGFINKLYHIVRNQTLQTKKKLIIAESGLQKGVLLDVGAGIGAFANIMKQAGWIVTGIEPDDTARTIAASKYQLQLQSSENLFTKEVESINVITMWHVLEHVHELHKYIDTFYKILKPNGTLIIAVPNYTSYDAEIYNEYWAAYDVPRHLYHFSPRSMELLMIDKGFTVRTFRPMWFDSFYVSMLSEKYKTQKNNLIKAVWNGIISNLKTIGNSKNCSSVIYVIKKK